MEITFRKAEKRDLEAVGQIYENILAAQENGGSYVGWVRGVYPTGQTAADALERGDLFVQEAAGCVVGAAIINRVQVDVYADVDWLYTAEDEQVMVLHTLVIEPAESGRGLGRAFVGFYEKYAAENGCAYLRMDTNARNVSARRLYAKLGYREAGVVPCVFNGISGVNLVMLEKRICAEKRGSKVKTNG